MQLPEFSIIILSAGNSSRLGSPKQFLKFNGKTLIRNILDEAISSGASEVVIIAGETYQKTVELFKKQIVKIIYNSNWQAGMSSSIKLGIENIHSDEAVFLVCDQPYISAELIKNLIREKIKTGKNISAATYANTLGTPACFNKIYFPALSNLKNDQGAKKIIMDHLDDVAKLDFPQGEIDIDTPDDYKKLQAIK